MNSFVLLAVCAAFGPDAEGRIPPEAQGILRAFGKLDY